MRVETLEWRSVDRRPAARPLRSAGPAPWSALSFPPAGSSPGCSASAGPHLAPAAPGDLWSCWASAPTFLSQTQPDKKKLKIKITSQFCGFCLVNIQVKLTRFSRFVVPKVLFWASRMASRAVLWARSVSSRAAFTVSAVSFTFEASSLMDRKGALNFPKLKLFVAVWYQDINSVLYTLLPSSLKFMLSLM